MWVSGSNNMDEDMDEIHEFAAENFDEEKILEVEKQLKQIAMYLKKKKILDVDLET